ncbi:MAG: hypothetical protein L0Z50_09465 [Verrucomicrobiales bacterium]|nr:hypothetical protein [Verrucomicrobiales bacterium]
MKSPLAAFIICTSVLARVAGLEPVVEIEEDVYTYTNANNGAGPMWCSGSTSLVRSGRHLFATGLETVPDAKPLNNCRWMLFHRGSNGWQRVRVDDGRTREPSPLAAFQDGRVFLSANPTLGSGPEPNGGPARPDVFQFAASDPKARPVSLKPSWQGAPPFSEHSYRSFAADGAAGELVLFQNIGYTHAEWTFRDRASQWSAQGQIKWPWGAEYDKPGPIRVCYPNVVLRDRAVHFFGVSDVVEPYKAWRQFKRELTGQQWDYDFRRLFYTWTRDITREPFAEWVEIASRDKTCGWVSPGDLWLAPNGEVHLLWSERAIDERLRAKFFPQAEQSHSLNYAVVREGKVVRRRTLMESTEDKPGIVGSAGRFHVTPDNRLFVVCYAAGTETGGRRVAENRLLEILPDGTAGPAVRLPLAKPFTSYFTTTVRGGSPPSGTLEMLGPRAGAGNTISYAQVRLFAQP